MAASKSPRLRLLHMRDEIESLSQELAGLSFETYRESYVGRVGASVIRLLFEIQRRITPSANPPYALRAIPVG